MKLAHKILLLAGLTITPATTLVHAEGGRGYDMFGATKAISTLDTNIVNGGSVTTSVIVDKTGCVGVASLYIGNITNSGNALSTNNLQTSPDQTNWVNIPYALSIPYSSVSSNFLYGIAGYTTNSGTVPPTTNGVGLNTTNILLLPGTPTTPNIAIAGFGTPYLSPTAITNTNSIVLTNDTAVWVGFNIDDCARYIRYQGVTYSNVSLSAMLLSAKTGN